VNIESAKVSGKNFQSWVFGTDNAMGSLTRKTFHAAPIKFCTAPDTNDNIRAAAAMTFRVKSMKVCATFRNTGNSPLSVHYCIVQPKETYETKAGMMQDWLKDGASSTLRFASFAEGGVWDTRQDCAPINKNKINVLQHKKFKLNVANPNYTTDNKETGSSYVKMDQYFKLNKTFQFEGTSSVDVMKPLWIVVYYEGLFADINPTYTSLECNINTHSFIAGR